MYSKVNQPCIYTRIHSLLDSISIQVITEHQIEFPVLCSRLLLAICFIYSNVYMSQFMPSPNLPLGNHTFVICICDEISVLWIGSLVSFFRFHIKAAWYAICFSWSDYVYYMSHLSTRDILVCTRARKRRDGYHCIPTMCWVVRIISFNS